MSRIGYDFTRFYEEKAKLRAPDGIHCIIPGCHNLLTSRQQKYCSQECYSNWYMSLNIDSWERVRADVIKRDGRCMERGVTSFISDINKPRNCFEVHHIISISEGGDEFDIDNCITFCSDCHIQKHSKIMRAMSQNKSLDDW